ncbi:MAG: hypothetical protein ABI843_11745 [Dokdonella sp.]
MAAFAKLLNMNRVSLSNYSKHECMPSHLAIIAVLMGEMADHGVDFQSPIQKIDPIAKRPRGSAAHRFGGHPQSQLDLSEQR